jgi:putative redox protein
VSDNWTEITANWVKEGIFIGQDSTGVEIQMGSSAESPGIGPMRLLLIALAGCTGMDIVSILNKKRIDLSDLQIRVRGKRAKDYPMIWTDIHLTYLMWSNDLKPSDAERAIRLSEDKYCSVGIMLGQSSAITSDFQILKPGEKLQPI